MPQGHAGRLNGSGIRDGGVGMQMEDEIERRASAGHRPLVDVLGVPTQFLPHGKPDRILARLGLDADGIVASIQAGLARLA